MSEQDYYETLGVSKSATQDEIKKAYRRLAMKYHPDRNQGDKAAEEKFKAIGEAYAILSDEEKRAAYDRFGKAGVDPNAAGGFGQGGFGGFGDAGAFSDIFNEIFGGGRAGGFQKQTGPRVRRGEDVLYRVELTLEEAAKGRTMKLNVNVHETCEDCLGTGARKGTKKKTCPYCNGTGVIRQQSGFFAVQRECPHCQGTGEIISDPCPTCRGHGRVRKTQRVRVPIPAGINDGQRVRCAGKGSAGLNGGPHGDLYIQVRLKPHDIFSRDGDDLHAELPISFVTATLGGEVQVPTLDGQTVVTIPAGTQSGKTFRLRGKGVPNVRTKEPGSLYLQVVVETPVNLSSKQEKLLREFEQSLKEGGSKHNPKTESFFDKMKSFFGG